jgi:hypothetical protein
MSDQEIKDVSDLLDKAAQYAPRHSDDDRFDNPYLHGEMLFSIAHSNLAIARMMLAQAKKAGV